MKIGSADWRLEKLANRPIGRSPLEQDPHVLWTHTSFGPLLPLDHYFIWTLTSLDPYFLWTLTSFEPLRTWTLTSLDPYFLWTLTSFEPLRTWTLTSFGPLLPLDPYVKSEIGLNVLVLSP
jgi:hypothetical protein